MFISKLLIHVLVFVIINTEETNRTYCQLPEAIYADNVTSASFGPSGWTYTNPGLWKNLVPTCGGNRQSPINIITANSKAGYNDAPTINYLSKSTNTNYTQVAVAYTKEVEGEFDSILASDYSENFTYYASQFHIHLPSEHQIDGVNTDLEIHFVHIAAEAGKVDCNNIHNKLTVFGLLFNRSPNASNYSVFDTMASGNVNNSVSSFDLSIFFNQLSDQTYFHYNGSLTTPPCSQTVNWYVFSQALPISTSQYNNFASAYTNTTLYGSAMSNSRPVQGLNNRVVTTGKGMIGSVATLISEGESKFGLVINIMALGCLII
ncbi:hypothetical protein pb186bvf_000180 [Paramecium bursaria]